MSTYPHNRRKNYFINKAYQLKFILKFCLVILLASVVTGLLTYYFTTQTTTVAIENQKVLVKSTADFIIPTVIMILCIVTLGSALTTAIVTLFTSHKIAGPLYRLSIELDKMKEGNFSDPVRIRGDDQLQKAAEDIEMIRQYLADMLREFKTNVGNLKQQVDAISDPEKKNEISSTVAEIENKLERYKV